MQKTEKWLKPLHMVFIWKYSARAIQWIPTWQGLDGFQRSLCPCALNKSSLNIGRVKEIFLLATLAEFLWDNNLSSYNILLVTLFEVDKLSHPLYKLTPFLQTENLGIGFIDV